MIFVENNNIDGKAGLTQLVSWQQSVGHTASRITLTPQVFR